MDIFFRNLPAKARIKDLYVLVTDASKPKWPWMQAPEITRCEILEITDQDTGQVEFHGLVTVRDPSVGEQIVKKLNGQPFHATVLEVREYAHRSPGDRRIDGRLGLSQPEERRRKNLKIERRGLGDGPKVEAYKDAFRQYGD